MLFSKRLLSQTWSPLCKMSPLLKPQRLGLFSMHPARSYISDSTINLNSNNYLVLEDDGLSSPTLFFRDKKTPVDLHGNLTLREVE